MPEDRLLAGLERAGSADVEGEKQDLTDGIREVKAIYDALWKDMTDEAWDGTGDEFWRKTREAYEKSQKITKRLKMHEDINEMNEVCQKFMLELTDERWNDEDDTFWRKVHEDTEHYKKKLAELGVIPDEPYEPFQERVSLRSALSASGGDESVMSGSGGGEPAQSGRDGPAQSGGEEQAKSVDGGDELAHSGAKLVVPLQPEMLPVQSEMLPVQSVQTGRLVLPPKGFVVPSKNNSMYGKKMCDVHMAGFTMESDHVIRFRKRDGKVVVGDLLVGMGKYGRVASAQDSILKMIELKNDKVTDLESMEVDKTLIDMVRVYFQSFVYILLFSTIYVVLTYMVLIYVVLIYFMV